MINVYSSFIFFNVKCLMWFFVLYLLEMIHKSRCSGCKFISIVRDLDGEKLNAIRVFVFGSLLQLASKELRYV